MQAEKADKRSQGLPVKTLDGALIQEPLEAAPGRGKGPKGGGLPTATALLASGLQVAGVTIEDELEVEMAAQAEKEKDAAQKRKQKEAAKQAAEAKQAAGEWCDMCYGGMDA